MALRIPTEHLFPLNVSETASGVSATPHLLFDAVSYKPLTDRLDYSSNDTNLLFNSRTSAYPSSFTMRFTTALAVILPASVALAADWPVNVGVNGSFVFDPSTVTAAAGDTVTFKL